MAKKPITYYQGAGGDFPDYKQGQDGKYYLVGKDGKLTAPDYSYRPDLQRLNQQAPPIIPQGPGVTNYSNIQGGAPPMMPQPQAMPPQAYPPQGYPQQGYAPQQYYYPAPVPQQGYAAYPPQQAPQQMQQAAPVPRKIPLPATSGDNDDSYELGGKAMQWDDPPAPLPMYRLPQTPPAMQPRPNLPDISRIYRQAAEDADEVYKAPSGMIGGNDADDYQHLYNSF